MLPIPKAGWSPFACRSCFREGEPVPLHRRLGCEHTFPDELKGLTPVEEKLIALNSCYGFHVKGHITVFPNNVMDEIHVSWQGALRPTPSDLSSLLSVRRRVVERALVWLKRNNPHYAAIEIDAAEMESWGDPAHGVPPLVYERLERNEPSAWEKTRTAHVVPPTERAMDDEGAVEIEEVLAMLNQGGKHDESRGRRARGKRGGRGMFALDGPPDVADVDKLRFACDSVRQGAADDVGQRLGQHARGGGGGAQDLLSSRNMSLRTWADTVLRRHGGRFATHHIFAFLVFNMGVRSRNRRVSMLSVTRKNFRKVERIARRPTTA
ncbi:PIF1-like helicase [Hirsutella rhossiliensis]